MKINYDREQDELEVVLDPEEASASLRPDDFEVKLDQRRRLKSLKVRNAARFVSAAVQAGVDVQQQIQQSPQGMAWYDADSSMISAYGYDPNSQVLDVAFHRSGVYRYRNVPLEVFEELRAAPSKGSYLREFIFDQYPWEKKGSGQDGAPS